MKPILIIYATREGQTRHIAEHLGAVLGARARTSELIDAAAIPKDFSLANYSAAIVGASLHGGQHESEMTQFVKQHVAELQQMPTVFLSVSLSEATVEDPHTSPEARAKAQADIQRTIDRFLAQTGWHPSHIGAVAGALPYSRYSFVMRFVMRHIAKKTGGPVDTSRDYEFTDWTKLDHLIDELPA